jgi:hypothetical protein
MVTTTPLNFNPQLITDCKPSSSQGGISDGHHGGNASRRIRYWHSHLRCIPTAAAAEALMLFPKSIANKLLGVAMEQTRHKQTVCIKQQSKNGRN